MNYHVLQCGRQWYDPNTKRYTKVGSFICLNLIQQTGTTDGNIEGANQSVGICSHIFPVLLPQISRSKTEHSACETRTTKIKQEIQQRQRAREM